MTLFRSRLPLALAFCALLIAAAYASCRGEPDYLRKSGLHDRTRVPDRVILTVTADPAHSQAVTWRTNGEVELAVAEIAPADHGPDFIDAAQRVEAVTGKLESDVGGALYHSVVFRGLAPATRYCYRVGDGEAWSEWNQFTTAAEGPQPLTFLYVGDAQNDIYSLWSRVIREGYSQAPTAAFIIHAGDLINRANEDSHWGEWHLAAGWINRTTPSLPVVGNHEYNWRLDGSGTLSRHWRPQFALPENGPTGLEETCYFVDVQGVRIVALNSNERQAEQAAWLDRMLASNPNRWTIVAHHHPLFSAARSRDNTELRALWQPIYDRRGVDLVLQGHDHTYARSNLTSGLNTRQGSNGVVYAVSVSGPKVYEVDREDWMERAGERLQLFQIVRVEGDRLVYESRTARGDLYDSFELRKRRSAPNELVNRLPDFPERLD